jgi:hypothetical protein
MRAALQSLLFSPPFSPLSLPGLAAGHDFSDLTTLFTDAARTTAAAADGDRLGGLTDKSGQGNHLAQSSASLRLTLKLAVQNGRSAGRSDGTDDYLSVLLGASVSFPATFYLAWALRSNATANGWGLKSAADAIKNTVLAASLNVGNATLVQYSAYTAAFHVLAVRMPASGSTVTLNLNGGANVTGNWGTAVSVADCITLGARGGGGGVPAAADYGESWLYSGSHSDAQVAAMVGYLNGRWAIF